MNMLHVRYAVEVANTGSINAASKKLIVAQPNISRSIKELEESLGIIIFNRNAKGMTLTPEGEEFIRESKKILKDIDHLDNIYKNGIFDEKKFFAVSVPKSGYISEAFAIFASKNKNITNFVYRETGTIATIKNVISNDFKLGIIRYHAKYDEYYKNILDEHDLYYELISEFEYKLITSKDSPVAHINNTDELKNYTELCHADPLVMSLEEREYYHYEFTPAAKTHVNVFERGSAFEFLAINEESFMWSAPIPKAVLDRNNLVQIDLPTADQVFKDILIYKNDYALSSYDKEFITELCNSKRKNF